MLTAAGSPFRHEALLYRGRVDFLRRTIPFIRDALTTAQPVLVAVIQPKIDALRDSLGTDAAKVRFEDMASIGRNPALIIPVWREFVEEHTGSAQGARSISEPIWAGRDSAELVECERHEALLNLAFASPPAPFRLVCPYDAETLTASVIAEARRNHPTITEEGFSHRSPSYAGLEAFARPFGDLLPEPSETPDEMRFDDAHLHDLRAFVGSQALQRGVDPTRVPDLILAVDEAATNSIRHGGGSGLLRIWSQDDEMICEVCDRGMIEQPLVGRVTPDPNEPSGFGLWLANQLCDLVQVRTSASGSSVRLHIGLL